jgi:hypothetical protein
MAIRVPARLTFNSIRLLVTDMPGGWKKPGIIVLLTQIKGRVEVLGEGVSIGPAASQTLEFKDAILTYSA